MEKKEDSPEGEQFVKPEQSEAATLEPPTNGKAGHDSDDDTASSGKPKEETTGQVAPTTLSEVVVEDPKEFSKATWMQLFTSYFILGWTAFGGPTAHIGQFQKAFVHHRSWMSEETFAELLALCQAVPGPASTQMSFAIGIFQKGVWGGMLTGVLFQYPGLIIMSVAGFGAAKWLVEPDDWLSGFSAGLAAVAVALVADAALSLGNKLCKDFVTISCCVGTAFITFYYQSQWIFPVLIIIGGLITIVTERNKPIPPARDTIDQLGLNMWGGGLVLLFWLAILIASIILQQTIPYDDARWIHWFEAFYLTGSVTYGGGQVVLPILENRVVQYVTVCSGANNSTCERVVSPDSWVTEEQFLAGLGLAQSIPGPLFNFAAYLGAIMGEFGGIAAAWFGLFGPGILIIYGVLPFWGHFRKWAIYKRAMPGLNSSAIGLIYASVFTLGLKAYEASPFPTASVSIGILGFWVTKFLPVPKSFAIFMPPLAVLGGGVLGIVAWATDCN